jgi:hypothetical protein
MDKKHGIKQYLKGFSALITGGLWLFVLQIVFSLLSMAMVTDPAEPMEIIRVLSAVMTASVFITVFFISKSAAQTSFQVYKNNYIKRKHNEEIPLEKRLKEYRWYNGLLHGLIGCLPSVILALIGLTQSHLTSESNWCGSAAMFINLVYVLPLINYGAPSSLYFVFLANFLVTLASGAGYYLHGEKLKNQFFELENKNRML